MVHRMVNEVGLTGENWRLVGGEMAGAEGIEKVRYSKYLIFMFINTSYQLFLVPYL